MGPPAEGTGAARRGAWGARTLRATAAAVGPEGARRGAWGARTVRATAAAMGPGEGWEVGKCYQQEIIEL